MDRQYINGRWLLLETWFTIRLPGRCTGRCLKRSGYRSPAPTTLPSNARQARKRWASNRCPALVRSNPINCIIEKGFSGEA